MSGAGRSAVAPSGAAVGPLPLWACGAVAGGLLGEAVGLRLLAAEGAPATAAAAAVAGATALCVLSVTTIVACRRGHGARLDAIIASVGVVLAVAATAGGRIATTDLGLLPWLAAHGGEAEATVTIAAEPRPIASGWQMLVSVDGVARDGAWVETWERAAVTHEAAVPLGSRWTVRATARPLPSGGYGRWLGRQHATVVLDVLSWEPTGTPGVLTRASETVRERVRTAATFHLDVEVGGLLVGFVTGDTRLLPEEAQTAMRATGLTHLTAVSGSNVAIVLAGVLAAASALRLGPRTRWAAVGMVVPWFAFVTRFEPSVLRAGVMALLLLLATIRGVPRVPRHALAVAVLVLLLVDPLLAGSLGLLLSALATAGVLVLAPLLRPVLPSWLPARLADVLALTLGAQLAVLPLLLGTFGEVGIASVPANLLAVPAAGLAAVLAFVGSVLALVHVEAAAWLFAAAGLPARVVLLSATSLADVGGTVDVARPSSIAGAVAVGVWLALRRRRVWSVASAAVVVLAVVVGSAPGLIGARPPAGLTITAIDVGQGDAFLIESPGARVLVDAGADATAAEWLRRSGRRSLDLLVVSHPHLDHVGGVSSVLGAVDVAVVWAAPLPTELPEAAELWALAAELDVPVRAPATGDVVALADLLIEVLHPAPGRPFRHTRSELNDSSLVLRIHHDGRRILLPGDIEVPGQQALLATGVDVSAEVLTVPHHGSATTDPAFLAAVAPRVGVISAGRDNRHGHPHPDTLAVLEQLGVSVRRTDLEGTLAVPVPSRHAVACCT